MTTPTKPRPPDTAEATAQFRQDARRVIERKLASNFVLFDSADMPTIVRETAQELLDAGLSAEAQLGACLLAAAEVARAFIGQSRRKVTQDIPSLGDQLAQSRPAFSPKRVRSWQEYEAWTEFTGTTTKRLPDMLRDELLAAAELHERPARTELAWADLLRDIAEGLDVGEKVRQHYTIEQLDALYFARMG